MTLRSKSELQHYNNAVQAWDKGSPKARSFEEARILWAPHLKYWCQRMEETPFMEMFTYRHNRAAIGWIEDVTFWETFWRAHTANRAANPIPVDRDVIHLLPYVEGASASRSLSFFNTIPEQAMLSVGRAFKDIEALIDVDVLYAYLKRAMGSEDKSMNLAKEVFWSQDNGWINKMPWLKKESLGLGNAWRGVPNIEKDVDFAARACSAYMLDIECQTNVMGHLFVNFPEDFDRDAIAAAIVARQGDFFDSGIDVEIVKLCSGYAPEKCTDAVREIGEIGKALVWVGPFPVGGISAMLQGMYDLRMAADLYNVVVSNDILHGADRVLLDFEFGDTSVQP